MITFIDLEVDKKSKRTLKHVITDGIGIEIEFLQEAESLKKLGVWPYQVKVL